MKKCASCGMNNPMNALVCSKCGSLFDECIGSNELVEESHLDETTTKAQCLGAIHDRSVSRKVLFINQLKKSHADFCCDFVLNFIAILCGAIFNR